MLTKPIRDYITFYWKRLAFTQFNSKLNSPQLNKQGSTQMDKFKIKVAPTTFKLKRVCVGSQQSIQTVPLMQVETNQCIIKVVWILQMWILSYKFILPGQQKHGMTCTIRLHRVWYNAPLNSMLSTQLVLTKHSLFWWRVEFWVLKAKGKLNLHTYITSTWLVGLAMISIVRAPQELFSSPLPSFYSLAPLKIYFLLSSIHKCKPKQREE